MFMCFSISLVWKTYFLQVLCTNQVYKQSSWDSRGLAHTPERHLRSFSSVKWDGNPRKLKVKWRYTKRTCNHRSKTYTVIIYTWWMTNDWSEELFSRFTGHFKEVFMSSLLYHPTEILLDCFSVSVVVFSNRLTNSSYPRNINWEHHAGKLLATATFLRQTDAWQQRTL